MTFYFAWADKEDSTFSETEHAVEDVKVFGFTLQHSEGDFPSLEVDIINPRVGLLSAGRKHWMWLSYDDGSTITPLFFGRMLGIPQGLEEDIIRLSFVARPVDFEAQVEAVADSMRVAPFYDEVWFSEEQRLDPDRVLEGYSALWHIDRVTHQVTASDIVYAEEGITAFGDDEVFYDSVNISHSQSPVRKVQVEAAVRWKQEGKGSLDIRPQLLKAFHDETPDPIYMINQHERPTAGMIHVIGGEDMMENWPKPGDRVGGGWVVGPGSKAELVGKKPHPPTLIGNGAAYAAVQLWNEFPGSREALRLLFDRAPGFVVEVVDHTWEIDAIALANSQGNALEYNFGFLPPRQVDFLWISIWRIAPTLTFSWDVARDRTERIVFDVHADVQPLLTDADSAETVRMNVSTVDVTSVHPDKLNPRYFATDRGKQSFEHLIAHARAILMARARAVDVQFAVPFQAGIGLSCRHGASLVDPRIPGGGASGKVKSYTLVVDGNNGTMYATVNIGCTVGRADEEGTGWVEPVEGTPTYVDGYVEGYQRFTGSTTVPITITLPGSTAEVGVVGYDDYSDQTIDDDGIDFHNLTVRNALLSIEITGGLEEQKAASYLGGTASGATEVMDRVNTAETTVTVNLLPLTGGPFESTIEPVLTTLAIPRTINLE